MIFDEFEEILFDGHPIARNILGTPELIKTFSKENILKFMDENYNTDQIVLSSVGNISMNNFAGTRRDYAAAKNIGVKKGPGQIVQGPLSNQNYQLS